jgi:hypothetical protein
MVTVTCTQLRAAFLSGRTPSGPEVAAHVRACPDCAELFERGAVAGRALGRLEESEQPELSRLHASLRRRLDAERGPRAWLRSRKTATRVGLALALAVTLIAAAHRRAHPSMAVAGGEAAHSWIAAASCFGYGSLFTALFLSALWMLTRRDSVSTRLATVGGLTAGGVGVAALAAHCPVSDPLHLVAGHASVVGAWAAACAVASWAAARGAGR